MATSILQSFRIWHRKISSVLVLFFFLIALTGLLLGWKSAFIKTVYDDPQVKTEKDYHQWLPLDTLEKMAVRFINEKTAQSFLSAESIQLRPAKGYISFLFKQNYSVQLDGRTGKPVHAEQKNSGWIQDLHDGALLDQVFSVKNAIFRKSYSTIMALALLVLTITGFYLWYIPNKRKKEKNQ